MKILNSKKEKIKNKNEEKMRYVTLNNGVKMPILGYGVYKKVIGN
ncbi:MAG: hypothetical protein ACRC51_02940 [Cetobacterium sp.]